MIIITRKEAIKQGLKRYFTGKLCINGHLSERDIKDWRCVKCNINRVKKNYIRNPLKTIQIATEYNKNNPLKSKIYKENWKKNNPEKVQQESAYRRALKFQRTLSWLNDGQLFEIECAYKYCGSLRKIGLNYHVDHEIPLRGEFVSGLHVPWNLQVIPAFENLSKGNRF